MIMQWVTTSQRCINHIEYILDKPYLNNGILYYYILYYIICNTSQDDTRIYNVWFSTATPRPQTTTLIMTIPTMDE